MCETVVFSHEMHSLAIGLRTASAGLKRSNYARHHSVASVETVHFSNDSMLTRVLTMSKMTTLCVTVTAGSRARYRCGGTAFF